MDRYSKVVLTVIACCLLYFVGKDAIGPVHAQQRVDVNIASIYGLYLQPMPVRVVP